MNVQLAHGVVETGVRSEFLIVAAGVLALAVVFFVQRTVRPVVCVVLLLVALSLGVGAFVGTTRPLDSHTDGASAQAAGAASLDISAPAAGGSVPAGEPVTVVVDLSNAPEGGHFDVRIDGEIATMTSTDEIVVEFDRGEHDLSVEYVNQLHEPFDPPLRDEITVTAE